MSIDSCFSQSQAEAITKTASRQTYYTIRLLVDRERVSDAYRAYGYFRWVDDILDAETGTLPEKLAFVQRQQSLLEACYRSEPSDDVCPEERMLVDLIHNDPDRSSGLHAYLNNMMGVMVFDVERRGRFIKQAELSQYSRLLATAVTEAMYYFIGHNEPVPCHPARYLAVTAAHITHMLRDTFEDSEAGYYNISQEFLQMHKISARDVESPKYREWVRSRVRLAHRYFKEGRRRLGQVRNLRCRLAAYAYMARFEWMLKAIENDDYCLRPEYPERKSLRAGMWMGWSTLASVLALPKIKPATQSTQHIGVKGQ